MTIHFGLVGAGGFGREVMPYARWSVAQQLHVPEAELRVYFIETWKPVRSECNGRPLISLDTFLALDGDRYFNVAVGNGAARAQIVAQIGTRACPIALVSPHAIVLEENQIAEGVVLCPNSMITSNAKIGRFFQANIYSYIAHDCVVGDFVTFAPGVRCNGHTTIGNYAYVGTNAVIKPGSPEKPLVIGAHAIVGMGAVVTKDVLPGMTVVGNPARPLVK